MSTVTVTGKFKVSDVLTDATSVKLSSKAGDAGVVRNDTGAVVVSDGVNMIKTATGTYEYTFDAPAANLTYTYYLEFVYAGNTYRAVRTITDTEVSGATLSNLRERIRATWPSNYFTSYLTDSKITHYINQVQTQICRGYNFWFMGAEATRATVDGTQKYLLPATGDTSWSEAEGGVVYRFKSEIMAYLINANNQRYDLWKRDRYTLEHDSRYSNVAGQGIPGAYALSQQHLYLYPIPNHEYNQGTGFTLNLNYYGYLPSLIADDDTTALSLYYPEILEYGAVALGYRHGQDIEMAKEYEAMALDVYRGMIQEDQNRKQSGIEEGFSPTSGANLGQMRRLAGGRFIQGTEWYTA
jgi:hypothetical protein